MGSIGAILGVFKPERTKEITPMALSKSALSELAAGPGARRPRDRSREQEPLRGAAAASPAAPSAAQGRLPGKKRLPDPRRERSYFDKASPPIWVFRGRSPCRRSSGLAVDRSSRSGRRAPPGRSWSRAVADSPFTELGVLRPDPLDKLGRHHLLHDGGAGRRGEDQQPLFDRAGRIGERHGRLERQVG